MSSPNIRLERGSTEFFLRIVDILSIGLGFFAAASHAQADSLEGYYFCAAGCIGLVSVMGEMTGLYRSWRGIALHREMNAVFLTVAYSMAGLLVAGFFLSRFTDSIGRASIALGAVLVTAGVI
jgi:hypothetical protein